MTASFPTSLPVLTNPTGADTLATKPHSVFHADANDEIEAIAAKVGTGASTPAANKVLTGTGTGTSAWVDLTTDTRVLEEFLGGTSVTGAIGAFGWRFLNGTVDTTVNSLANHPGIVQLSTTATISTLASLYMAMGNVSNLLPAEAFDATWIFRPTQTNTDTMMRVGLMSTAASDPSANGIFLEKVYADTTWFAVCRSGGTQTRTAMDTVAAATWYRLRIRRVGATIGFTINGGTEVIISTNIPTALLYAFFQMRNQTAVAMTMDVDAFFLAITGMTR